MTIHDLKKIYQERKIDRRAFLEGAAMLGISSSSAMAVAKTAEAAALKRGGAVNVGVAAGETSDGLDVATINNRHQSYTVSATSEFLTEIDGSGDLKPRLAESWNAEDNGLKWIFDLRKDVEHSNGKSVDADDVIATLRHHVKEDSKSAFKPNVEQIEEMTADGKNRVIFKLKARNADFPSITADYRAAILPSKNGEPMVLDASIGAGPYKLESFEPGVRAILVRNDNHWNDDGAYFDEIELLSIKDDNARQTALITGSIDIMHRCNLSTVDKLSELDSVQVISIQGKQHHTYAMRTDTAPFDNNDVRLAVKHSIDREQLVSKLLRGYGFAGNDQPISPAYKYYDPSIPQRVYDPDKAKYHLKKAGLDSLDIELFVDNVAFTGAVDGAVLFSEHAKKSGINLKAVKVPADGYWSNVWMKKPFFASTWFGRPVADQQFTLTYAEGASWNETFWKHERFNKLLLEARSELDTTRRAELYGEMQRIVRDEGGEIIPIFANWVDAVSTRISTPEKVSGVSALDGGRFFDRWSFKS